MAGASTFSRSSAYMGHCTTSVALPSAALCSAGASGWSSDTCACAGPEHASVSRDLLMSSGTRGLLRNDHSRTRTTRASRMSQMSPADLSSLMPRTTLRARSMSDMAQVTGKVVCGSLPTRHACSWYQWRAQKHWNRGSTSVVLSAAAAMMPQYSCCSCALAARTWWPSIHSVSPSSCRSLKPAGGSGSGSRSMVRSRGGL
mmetsp:Transcript_13080/g.32002  ORF Transcript_13080/g.32002 Transcript_13080/m.32002 type:complete len:201 (+) Transcript_13080:766-1368(+)